MMDRGGPAVITAHTGGMLFIPKGEDDASLPHQRLRNLK
jgi:hypothetical protein